MSGELYIAEMMGPGGALLDFDNDGDLDVYLPQGAMLGQGKTLADARFPPRSPLGDRLYRNDLEAGTLPRFVDVTAEAGIAAPGYGMGVAVGDVDNDGWPDIYVTNLGSNQLWRNDGPGADGTVGFSDVTAAAGVDDTRWSTAATFLDFDRDGWLDLFVGNYVDFSDATHKVCYEETSVADYCSPLSFRPAPDRLLRNRGPGKNGAVTFEDVTAAAGLAAAFGNTLGAVASDFDGDGWVDLYVANDAVENLLWINQGGVADGRVTFREEALPRGCAVNGSGGVEGSMGVDAADFDGDGDDDLFLTHLVGESNTLYRNLGDGQYQDSTIAFDLASPSLRYTSFGTAWLDFDNDGWPDLLVANGAVKTDLELARAGDPYPLHQPNQLFRNLGGERFVELEALGERSEVSRGAAFGDLDNDGDTDVLVVNNNGPARLLLNQVGAANRWLGLRLIDAAGRRDPLAVRVAVTTDGGRTVSRRSRRDGSYCSANDPRVLVGLGAEAPESVTVVWPSGLREAWRGLAAGSYHTLREGSGTEIAE
ncbi:MAG: CRTAC1 family protein [bacterium]|nr:CRTAC1 family protein [bacterium]